MGDLYSFHSSQKSSFLHQIHIHTQGLWSRCQCCYPKSHSDPRTSSYLKEASHTHTHTQRCARLEKANDFTDKDKYRNVANAYSLCTKMCIWGLIINTFQETCSFERTWDICTQTLRPTCTKRALILFSSSKQQEFTRTLMFKPEQTGHGVGSHHREAFLPIAASFQGRYFLSPVFGEGMGRIMLLPHLTIQTNTKPSCLLQGLFYFSSFAIGFPESSLKMSKLFSISTPKHHQRREHLGWVRTKSSQCPPSSASMRPSGLCKTNTHPAHHPPHF